ncbi:MAG TPA: MmgE/PrpD family protein [Solirubrobacteraceae bacterium]|jgi:2-methylcitrate dehydratase PrpD|nr:MmgE/PrpD family protein [Solirubrobacteraceae bacterium]
MTHVPPGYAVAFLDWLGCACAGRHERAAVAMRALGNDLPARVAFAATAGHVLDYDDTLPGGIAHVSAPCAPAALMLADELDLSLRAMLAAFAEGWEAMAAVASASHPSLYDRGWHPTAVCGPVGAAVAAARLLDLSEGQRASAVNLAILRAGGTRGAFGSDGKAIQVGLAAAAGVQAALLARAGAMVDARAIHGGIGFEDVLGAVVPAWVAAGGAGGGGVDGAGTNAGGVDGARAIEHNWIKLHPSCLGTHAPIDAAAQARAGGYRPDGAPLVVAVHPVARQAAHLDDVDDGLAAKFSIPYCVAHALIHGPPRVGDFSALDPATRERSAGVSVVLDESLPEFGAVLSAEGRELARVRCPQGAPERSAAPADLVAKLADLAGDRLDGVLDDLDALAARALDAAGLRPAAVGGR